MRVERPPVQFPQEHVRLRRQVSGMLLLVSVIATAALVPCRASAQEGFRFQQPKVTLAFRYGYAMPMEGSEIFSFSQEELTIDSGDFDSGMWGGGLAFTVHPRFDVTLDLAYSSSRVRSEFREWVDQDDQPIEQVTTMTRLPVTAGVRWYPLDRGRQIGNYAWVPSTWLPYIGAGGGFMWHEFEQSGDFVDFETLDIFSETFASSGYAAAVFGAVGLGIAVRPGLVLNAEARYLWSEHEMQDDFQGFDPLDLSGFEFSAGIALRF